MTFRNKILLSIYGVVLAFLLITFITVNYWARNGIESTFADELRTSASTLNMLLRQQAELLQRACMVIAESPRLKAVAELRDTATAYQASMEVTQTSLNDLYLLTDDTGAPLVQILGGDRASWSVNAEGILSHARGGVSVTDLWYVRDGLYKVATAPVMAGDRLQGSLTIGFRYTPDDLQTLRKAVQTAMALVMDTTVLFSTVAPAQQADVATLVRERERTAAREGGGNDAGVFRFSGRQESWLALSFDVPSPEGVAYPRIRYIMMKPVQAAVSTAMEPILQFFAIAAAIVLVITFALGTVIARGISRPVRALVVGAAEIGRGNYDYRIDVSGKDEMSLLARRFGEMSASLKDKMTQLDKLNRDLVGRNEALDDALRQLQDAQREIVRSERLAATGRLTAQLAHEINNPIHNIQSCLKTALHRLPEQANGRELISVAYEEIERMSRLTRQMLDVYRGSMIEIPLVALDANAVVRDVVASLEQEFRRQRIECGLDLQDGLPALRGSRDKLTQVCINLLLNARDAMPNGGRVTVASRSRQGKIHLTFSDTGMGIPRENLERVFDAFFTTKSKVSGVGLGLSVSYGIIAQHKGTITVESEPGKGTVFTIILPAVAPES
jgi:signal transduction histidine kinase